MAPIVRLSPILEGASRHMASTARFFPLFERASNWYVCSLVAQEHLSEKLMDRFAHGLDNQHPLVDKIEFLTSSLQIPFILRDLSQSLSAYRPAYQKYLNLAEHYLAQHSSGTEYIKRAKHLKWAEYLSWAEYGMIGLSVTALMTQLLQSHLEKKNETYYSKKIRTFNKCLGTICVWDKLIVIAQLQSIVLTLYTAYTTGQIKTLVFGALSILPLTSDKLTNSIIKVAATVLKMYRFYFAKSNVEKVALGLWLAFDIYDLLIPLNPGDKQDPSIQQRKQVIPLVSNRQPHPGQRQTR